MKNEKLKQIVWEKYPFDDLVFSFIISVSIIVYTLLTHYQTTNFRLFETKRVCR